MSKKTPNSFLIPSSKLRFYSPRLYQRIFAGVTNYEALANRIIKLIQPAQAFRDLEDVREMATILRNVPIERYRLVGDYYLLWCKCREGEYDTEAVENIIDRTNRYKPKGLLLRAAMEGYQSNIDGEIYFYKEALKASPTVSEYIAISNAIAVVKAKQGSHQSAIRDLERLVPLIKYADPLVYFDLLNSYAVELGEVGRIYAARNISQIVIHSPFAFAYPEWQETANDLKGLNRSFVAFKPFKEIRRNVLSMPVREHTVEAQQKGKRARVMSLQKWREKMAKDKTDEPKLTDTRDILMWIMNTYTDEGTSDYERYKMYEAVSKIMAERNKPKPDDDTEGA